MKYEYWNNFNVRVVTKPFRHLVHILKEGDKIFFVNCSMYHGACQYCSQKNMAAVRWFLGSFGSVTNSPRIISIGPDLFSAIQSIHAESGDLSNKNLRFRYDKKWTVELTSFPPSLGIRDVPEKRKINEKLLTKLCIPPRPEEESIKHYIKGVDIDILLRYDSLIEMDLPRILNGLLLVQDVGKILEGRNRPQCPHCSLVNEKSQY